MYRVSIELYRHEWKFGRTRNAVGTRAAGECFHSFFEFSQTFTRICSFLTWFGHDFLSGQFVSVRSHLIAATTLYSGFFQLSLVTRFACDIGQLARIWI